MFDLYFKVKNKLYGIMLPYADLLFQFYADSELFYCKLLVLMHFAWSWTISYEPNRDKTNKMACAPSKDSNQPGYPPV